MKIGIVSAEPSGDLLGSKILSKIKEHFQNIEVIGVGGGTLEEHNLSTDREMLEIMGLVDPILNFQKIVNYRNDLIETFIDEKIDIFIGIDAPDFNFEIHKKLQKKGIKTVHVVCPSVWAWRPGRVKKSGASCKGSVTSLRKKAKAGGEKGKMYHWCANMKGGKKK